MGKTPIYHLGYLEPNQDLSENLDLDELRFKTIETQTYALYQIFKNGIIEDESNNYISWQIDTIANDYQNVSVTSGKGHVSWKATETTSDRTVALPVLPTGITSAKVYLYAIENVNTPVTKDVDFISSLTEITDTDNYIALGGVDIDLTTNPYTFTVFTDNRQLISLFSSISDVINKHKHIGGTANPSPIDLSRHVRGKLSGEYIENLDISAVTTGTLDAARLPQIDHTTLTNIGTLSHSQIDDLLASLLRDDNTYRLSDLSIANRLQTLVALKKLSSTYYYVDTTQVNTLVYVPGIYPNIYTNANTGALANFALKSVPNKTLAGIFDTGPYNASNNFIRATSSDNVTANNIYYNTKRDFTNAESYSVDNGLDEFVYNIKILGSSFDSEDGYFTIDTPLNFSSVNQPVGDVFNTALSWNHGYVNTQTLVDSTFKLDTRLYAFQTFDAKSWDGVTSIGIGFTASNPEALSHIGDIYMYLILPSTLSSVSGVTQVSFSDGDIYPSTAPSSVYISTPYKIFQEFTGTGATNSELNNLTYRNISLSNFISSRYRTSILGIGFYWSTLNGWNPEKKISFSLNTPTDDQVNPSPYNYNALQTARKSNALDSTASTFVWNDSLYSKDGKFLVRFDSGNTSTQYGLFEWNATQPVNTLYNISTRTDLNSSVFHPLVNTGDGVDLSFGNFSPSSETGRYLDVLFTLNSDVTRTLAPSINKFIITYNTVGAGSSKTWNTNYSDSSTNQIGWISDRYNSNNIGYGSTYYENSIAKNYVFINSTTDIGNWLFLRNNSAVTAEINSNETVFEDGVDSGSLRNYLSPVQVYNKSTSYGFNKPKDFYTTIDNSKVYCDTENDSVVMFDANGAITKLIQGNLRLKLTTRDFVALSASYNPDVNKIWVAFSQNVSSTIDKSKIYIKYTANGRVNLIDLNNSGIDTTGTGLFTPLVNNKSATLQILLSDELNTILASAVDKSVVFDTNSVINDSTSDNSSISGTFAEAGTGAIITDALGGGVSGSTFTTGTITSSGTTTSSTGSTCKVIQYLVKNDTVNYNGSGTCINGLPQHITASFGSTDFNLDGVIPSATLLGPNNQQSYVTLDIIQGPIFFENIYNPISVQVNSTGQWIIAQPFINSVLAYNNDTTNSLSWVIQNSVVEFIDTKQGSAYEMSDGNILIGAPALSSTDNGKLLVVNRQSNNALVSKVVFPGLDVIRALSSENNNVYYVLLDDTTNDGLNTKLTLMNPQGKVISSWPNAVSTNDVVNPIVHPKGLRILSNGDVLVSE